MPAEAMTAEAIKARDKELMAQALRAAQVRAGTDRVGFPTRVVDLSERPEIFGTTAVRIEFSHQRGTVRVCPISRTEHESNHFFVTLGAEPCTGLPALFMYCHSVKDCNAGKKREMLAFVEPESFETLGIVVPTDPTAPKALVPTRTAGQTVVLLGKMQEQEVDRLMENPGGAWDTVPSVGEVACALCTAASKHPAMVAVLA